MMDLVAEIVRRMREQYHAMILQEFRHQYQPLSEQAIQELVHNMTKKVLPYVKQRVDQQYEESLAKTLKSSNKS